jgi:ABC-type sugar transport system ATPase subunit
MRVELKNLQRKLNITTLYVTHDQTEAMTLGDRIALMRNGSLIQTGTPAEMYERPQDPFAATFIGSLPMNLIPGKIMQAKEERVAVIFGDRVRLPLRPVNFRQKPDSDEILLGIRPEHIALKTRDGGQSLTTRVSAIEPLGREVLLHLKSDQGDLTALSDKKHYKTGQTISVSFDTDHIHIFRRN